jgi:hypothetical protein
MREGYYCPKDPARSIVGGLMRVAVGPAIRRFRLLALRLVLLFATVSFPRTSVACSCSGEWTQADAEVIFRGKVVEVHEPMLLRLRPRGPYVITRMPWAAWFAASKKFDSDVRTVFEVETAWKGQPAQFVTVNTGSGLCCDCTFGNIFKEGQEYLLYATRHRGELGIGSCAGIALFGKTDIDAEAARLGPGMKPTPGARSMPMFWQSLLLPSAVAAPFMLGLLIWWARGVRKPSELRVS